MADLAAVIIACIAAVILLALSLLCWRRWSPCYRRDEKAITSSLPGSFDREISTRALLSLCPYELSALRTEFINFVARTRDLRPGSTAKSPELTRGQFIQFVQRFAKTSGKFLRRTTRPAATDETALTFIFDLLDTDHNGAVSLQEYLCGISVLSNGSKGDRLRFLFYMYDSNGSGVIREPEFRRVVAIMRKMRCLLDPDGKRGPARLACGVDIFDTEWDDDALVEAVLESADSNGDGVVTFDEFRAWADENHIVSDWFDWISSECGDAVVGVRENREHELQMLELERVGIRLESETVLEGWNAIRQPSISSACVPSSENDNDSLTQLKRAGSQKVTASTPEALSPFVLDYADIRLGAEIGSGAFARVFEAEWLQLPVAVKVLHEGCDEDEKEKLRENLLREVNVLTALRHPNIILYMGLCMDVSSPPCVVTELFHGGSLSDFLSEVKGTLEVSIAKKIALNIARGMVYLHSSRPKVLHRDLKSRNILIGDKNANRVVICDFGLSKFARTDCSSEMSDHGANESSRSSWSHSKAVGTAYTMAPEVIQGGPYTSRADVYSFGIVLWEIFAGRCNPFTNTSSIQLLYYVVEGGRPKMDYLDKAPCAVKALLEQCWAQDPHARPEFSHIARVLYDVSAGQGPQSL